MLSTATEHPTPRLPALPAPRRHSARRRAPCAGRRRRSRPLNRAASSHPASQPPARTSRRTPRSAQPPTCAQRLTRRLRGSVPCVAVALRRSSRPALTAARSELSPRARRCRSNSPGAGDPSAWFWLQRLVRRRRSSSPRVTPALGAISASLSTSRSRRCRRNSPPCVATPTLGTALAAPPATQPRARRPRIGPRHGAAPRRGPYQRPATPRLAGGGDPLAPQRNLAPGAEAGSPRVAVACSAEQPARALRPAASSARRLPTRRSSQPAPLPQPPAHAADGPDLVSPSPTRRCHEPRPRTTSARQCPAPQHSSRRRSRHARVAAGTPRRHRRAPRVAASCPARQPARPASQQRAGQLSPRVAALLVSTANPPRVSATHTPLARGRGRLSPRGSSPGSAPRPSTSRRGCPHARHRCGVPPDTAPPVLGAVAAAARSTERPARTPRRSCKLDSVATRSTRLPIPLVGPPAQRSHRLCSAPQRLARRCRGSVPRVAVALVLGAAAPVFNTAAAAHPSSKLECPALRWRRTCRRSPGAGRRGSSPLRAKLPGTALPRQLTWHRQPHCSVALQRLVRRHRTSSLRVTPARGAILASRSTSQSRRCRRNNPPCVATPTLGTTPAARPAMQPGARRPRVGPLRLGPRPALARSTPPLAQASRHTCPAVPCATAQLSAAQPTHPASRTASRAATGTHLGSQSRARRGSQPASRHNYAQGSSRAPPPRSLVPAVTLASPRHGYPRDRSSGGRLAPQLLRGTATTSPALRLACAPRHHHPLGAAPLRYWPTPPCLTLLQQPAWRHNLTLDDATAARLAP